MRHFAFQMRRATKGNFRSYGRSGNRGVDDQVQSTAAIGRRPPERYHSPKRSFTILLVRSISDAQGTSAVRSAELVLPTRSGLTVRGSMLPEQSLCRFKRGVFISVECQSRPHSAYAPTLKNCLLCEVARRYRRALEGAVAYTASKHRVLCD